MQTIKTNNMSNNSVFNRYQKVLTFPMLFLLALLVGCTEEEEPTIDEQILGTWNLIQVTGGIAGLDCMFEEEAVTWTFASNSIEIKADNLSISLCPIIDNQDHTYTILFQEDVPFLLRDNEEFGQVTITESVVDEITRENLSVDGTVFSTGQINDGFIFSFVRNK